MNRRTWFLLATLVSVLTLLSEQLKAQQPAFTKKEAFNLVIKNAASLSLSPNEVKNVFISDAYYDKFSKLQMVYLQQSFKNIPVYNSVKSIAFKNETVVSNTGSFISKMPVKVNSAEGIATVTTSDAVSAAIRSLGKALTETISPVALANEGNVLTYPSLGVSKEEITGKLLWVPTKTGEVKLCWQIKILPIETPDYFLINIDAVTGLFVSRDNLTVFEHFNKPANTATIKTAYGFSGLPLYKGETSTTAVSPAKYRVIPFPAESMIHIGGTPIIVSNPWENAGPNNPAATLGWHNDGASDHDSTRGNNVWAREDRANKNGTPLPGRSATSITRPPSLTFDFPFNSQTAATSIANQNFAITQLFYWNNIMHDITYQYGFDEAAGNFQRTNLDRGGVGNDFVYADAQDGSGTNNANFTTPEDGRSPRMQMYLFNGSKNNTLKINAPSTFAGFKVARESGFSINNSLADKGPITADVVLYSSIDGGNNQGCTETTASFAGKIVLIERGNCTFTVKVKNAQNAGALAAIIINNITGDPTVMGGTDNTITIPAVMMSLQEGNDLKTALQNGQTVNATLQSINLDGDLDNGIMAHEYAHGISSRLTGGPSNAGCLTNVQQMGEGWSDHYALMTTTNWETAKVTDGTISRGIGSYAFNLNPNNGEGIRTYPYTTDMSVNTWTYDRLQTTAGEAHTVGEIWAATLWDMTWNLIKLENINPNIYNAAGNGGNSISLKLVTEAMKLQTCRPGFLDGRDAILKADTILYNGKYSCAIWNAFARRGMGAKAKQGSSDSYNQEVADFSLPGGMVNMSVDKVIAAQNDVITYTLTANCKCDPISNFKIVDTLAPNVNYISGGNYNAANRTVTFDVPDLAIGQSHAFTLKVKSNSDSYTAPVQSLSEPIAGTPLPSTFTASASGAGFWRTSNIRSHSRSYSLRAIDADSISRQVLTTTAAYNISGISTLSFWHYFNTEAGYDGGVVELSVGSDSTWIDAGPYIVRNGYNSAIGNDSRQGFSGYVDTGFIQTVINLSSFKDKTVRFRFVFTSDEYVGGEGWFIDDIELRNEAGIYNAASLLNAGNQLQDFTDTVTLLSNLLPLTWKSFTAQKQNISSVLKWTTANENNSASFAIERSTDGIHFTSIGTVSAFGNSSVPSNYNYVDFNPSDGINYYRIKQMDIDGHQSYSETRSVEFMNGKALVTISPNPVKNKLRITIKGNTKDLQGILYNAKGQKVHAFKISGEDSEVNLPIVPAGVYFININDGHTSSRLSIVIE